MEEFSLKTGIEGAAESKIGGRGENQDDFGYADTASGPVLIVCDGMGGGPAGKTASSLATRSILDYLNDSREPDNPIENLSKAVQYANSVIWETVENNPNLKGMGTTCVCVLFNGDKAYVVHVGDSRCYLVKGKRILFRTNDHSQVGELVRKGVITEEEARNSSFSNIITRALGIGPEVTPEIDVITMAPGERIALMTDGIWGTFPETELVNMLSAKGDLTGIVGHVADEADHQGITSGGGHDNLTLVMAQKSKQGGSSGGFTTKFTYLFGIIAVIVVAAVLFFCFYPFGGNEEKDTENTTAQKVDLLVENNNETAEIPEKKIQQPQASENSSEQVKYLESQNVDNNNISRAKTILNELKEFNKNKAIQNQGNAEEWSKFKDQRQKMLGDVLDALKKAEGEGNGNSSQINDVISYIESNSRAIVTPDRIQYRTTAEGIEIIDNTLSKLNQIN